MRHKQQIIYDGMAFFNPFGQNDWYLHILTINIIKCEVMKHRAANSQFFHSKFWEETERHGEKQTGYFSIW